MPICKWCEDKEATKKAYGDKVCLDCYEEEASIRKGESLSSTDNLPIEW